jgi:nucleotide-binding universal stress UspA family protein
MKHILVPVDFSDTSAAALRFGTYLAEMMDLDLLVVHVFDANFSFTQVVSNGALLVKKENLEKKLNAFTQSHAYPVLAAFQGNLKTLPALKTEVLEGFPSRVIRALSEREETELVVMGGVGAGKRDTPAGIFGGIARQVGLHGGCPVILLPPGYGYPAVNCLAIAFGEAKDIEQMGDISRRIIKALRPEVRFVHVAGKDDEYEWKNDGKFLEMALGAGFPSYTFSYDVLPPGPIANGLLDYAREQGVGLLVLAHKKRSFWNTLFSTSRAKQIINHSEVPLLVVPLPQKS